MLASLFFPKMWNILALISEPLSFSRVAIFPSFSASNIGSDGGHATIVLQNGTHGETSHKLKGIDQQGGAPNENYC